MSWVLAGALFACGKDEGGVTLATGREAASQTSGVASAQAAPAAAPTQLQDHRTFLDLIANRVHAHVHQGGRLVISAGDVDFLKYVDGGWKTSWVIGEKDRDRAVAFVAGLSSTFFFPFDADVEGPGAAGGDLTLGLTLRAVAPNQRLSIFVNEKPVGTIDVASDWKEAAVPIPAAALVRGENRVRLTFRGAAGLPGGRRGAAAIERITIGGGQPVAVTPVAVADETLGGTRKRAYRMSGPSRLSFYTQVPPGAKLAASAGAAAGGSTVSVRVARDGAAATTVAEAPLQAGSFRDVVADLGAYANQAVRIDLVARGGGALWGEPRLVVKAEPLAAASVKKFDRVYIWMIDTLRADKLSVYNPKSAVPTPNLDAFAKDATLFKSAQVPGTWSLPSHSSILTGVYPSVHKANAHEARLSPNVPFAAETLKKAGYRTGLFSSNGYVSSKWGFDRGWDESRNFIRESLPNGAEYLWKTAKAWMFSPANGQKSQFVYLATVDPHVIYNPRKEFLAKFWAKPYKGPIKPTMTGIQLGQIKTGKLRINETDKAYITALYNAEVAQADNAFGAFIADLKTQGVYDTSAIIVVSDHGDEFWEHGDVGHAQGVHQELVHIPLIVRAPGMFPAGKVVGADVEAMDVYPTLLDLAGLPANATVQGSSLLPLALDEAAHSPRVALTQNGDINRGMKSGRYRIIHAGIGRVGIFDTVDDPLEQKDVAAERPIALRQMRAALGLLLAFESKWKKASWGTPTDVTEAFYKQTGS